MEAIISKLESKQKELLTTVSKDDFAIWLASAPTKALLTQLRIDELELAQNWSLGRYEGDQQLKAQGQAGYISGMVETIKTLWSDQHEQ